MSPRDHAALAAIMEALSDARRLELLSELRSPAILRDIRVAAPGGEREHDIARQAVKRHLQKLVEAGVVNAHPTKRDFGETLEYVVNHQRLFAVSEELRELAKLRPVEEVEQPTHADGRSLRTPQAYPRLVVVRGLDEGKSFPLVPVGTAARSWMVGRKRTAELSFDYDPFVSGENTLIHWSNGTFAIEPLPTSRNGTQLNFVPLVPGRRVALEHGDVVGVGHTVLVFQSRASERR